MALDVKKIIASEFLELCEHKDLRKITIGEIQKKVGLSRQTFYKHFQDKDDLIQYCYDTQIVPKWEMSNDDFKSPQEEWEYTYKWTLGYIGSIKEHRKFMKAACEMSGPNCLWKHMIVHNKENEIKWRKMNGETEITEDMNAVIEYHTMAYYGMILNWIFDDMPISEEEFVNRLLRVNKVKIDDVFGNNNGGDCFYAEIFKTMKS